MLINFLKILSHETCAIYEPFGIAVHGVLRDSIAGYSTVIL